MGARRIGRLDICKALLDEYPDVFEKYLPDFQVLDSRQSFEREGVITYLGICGEFDEVKEGELIPEYQGEFHLEPDGRMIRYPFRKVK